MINKTTKGSELLNTGIAHVGKISLWGSQSELINKIYTWSEQCGYLWEWYETRYELSPEGLSNNEISFIFYLTKELKNKFINDFPSHWIQYVRWEIFDPKIFDHYTNARKGKNSIKHLHDA